MRGLMEFINEHKEWIFSGIGVAVLGTVAAVIRHLIKKRKPQALAQTQSQEQTQTQSPTIIINNQLYPSDNTSHHLTTPTDTATPPPTAVTTSPPKPNNKFAHREKEIYQLNKKITQTQKLALVNGLGGVGKTTIAKALFHQLKEEAKYPHMAWIEYQENIKESLLKAFTLFTEINDPDTRYTEILRFITTAGKDIIIFIDNVSENADDLDFLETLDATVVLTSRREEIGNFEQFPIGFLDELQCIDIFYNYYKYDKERKHKDIVKKLVGTVACHTLSVELLARVASVPDYPLAQFAEDLEKRGFSYFDLKIETDHSKQNSNSKQGDNNGNNSKSTTIAEHLAKLFALSAEKAAEPESLSAEKAANPESLPEQIRILKNIAILPSVPMPSDIKKWLNCNVNDLQRLVAIGWLTASEDGYYMHPIIKESITLQYGKPSYDDCAEMIDYMRDENYIKLTDPYTKSHFKLTLAEAVMEQFYDVEKAEVSNLLNNIAFEYNRYGEYDKALHWYEKDLKISEKIHDTDHPDTATTYNNIAGVYYSQGKYDEALHWYEKALKIKEKALDTDHPSTATTYNSIAVVYTNQGRYDKAVHWFEKALKIREKALGTDHPSTATTYNNIAVVYKDQGKYDEALHWYEKALKIYEKSLGTDHPDTATTYHNISLVHYNQGNYAEALSLVVQAYCIRLKKLGENHPSTKDSKNGVRFNYTALHDNPTDFDHWLSTQL
ncbi:MAG: tetratricopeptide repeat protein [Defluviitaleaceae bacterium]|nr:tetratricopeptide repeat protein [Defluviitaleaceae bacterium]